MSEASGRVMRPEEIPRSRVAELDPNRTVVLPTLSRAAPGGKTFAGLVPGGTAVATSVLTVALT